MKEPTLKELLARVGVEVRRVQPHGVALYDTATGEKLHSTPRACYEAGQEIYQKRIRKND